MDIMSDGAVSIRHMIECMVAEIINYDTRRVSRRSDGERPEGDFVKDATVLEPGE